MIVSRKEFPNFRAEYDSIMARLEVYLDSKRKKKFPITPYREIKVGYDKRRNETKL